MRSSIFICLLIAPSLAAAQWAGYDEEVKNEIRKINNVERRTIDKLKDFEKLEDLEVDCSKLTSLTDADKAKYVGTKEDCGDEKLNAKHYEACEGPHAKKLSDVFKLQVLTDGYKQREKAYEMQMAEARRATDVLLPMFRVLVHFPALARFET